MKKLVLVCVAALALSSTALASDIVFYVGAPNVDGWYDVDSMNADVETIITQTGHLFVDVQQFDDDQFDDFGDWVDENTDDGEMDILWLNGCVPSVLYPYPNLEPDGSRIEEWLDGGNMIINVGDWFGYVSYEGGPRQAENGPSGAANILDLASGIIVSADNTSLTVTPTGKEYLPSIGDTTVITYRPIALSAVQAPWEVAALFASTGGTDSPTEAQADPLVIYNTETGAYVAFINQSAGSGPPGWLDDRGLTCAEFIANWVATVIGLGNPAAASDPSPADEAVDIPRDVVLGWASGQSAVTHDVYFGTSFDDVNNATRGNPLDVLVSQDQSENTYDPEGLLEFGTTYYWRIDEVNGAPDFTIFKGEVWSFTAEPEGYPITGITATSNATSDAGVGPERTIDGSGLNELDQHSTLSADMWLGSPAGADPVTLQYEFDSVYKMHEMLVWNYNVQFELILGFGLKDVTIDYSENGADWTALGDVELAQATAKSDYTANTTVDFQGVPAQFVRLTVNSGYGMMGQYGLSEVRFLYIPAQAREPQPADGETNVLVGSTLSWRAGREAVTHDVYLGTDAEALPPVDSVSEASYTPGNLEFGNTYYWRIDEVNEADEVSVWQGNLWSFAAQEFAVIDDMESYDDEENRIYDTWLDGFVNGTGSTVGYFEAPFAEQTIVNSGSQSMPLEYDNSIAPFYSEADLDVGSGDWTGNGADTLRIFFAGQAPDFLETADGAIVMNAIGTDIWDTADEFRYAYKQLTGDGSMVARVDDLDGAPSTWAKAGVMVRQSTAVGSTHSFMCMTGGDGNGASWQGRTADNSASVNNDATSAVAPPYWVRIDRAGDSLTGSVSPDGETWTQIGDPRSIAMTEPVLIGLALTSHNANMATSATFSNISFSGSVSGDWQIAEIGVAQPEGNIPEALYVAIEDTSGNVAVVTHPDPGATGRSGWTEWLIPYSDLAVVNLGRVAVVHVGIGDRDNPTAGGTGLVFIDDIGYGHPAPEAAPVNLLANGGFEDGVMDPWSIYGDATGEVVADDPAEGDSCLHITVNSAGANFWDAGLQHAGHVFEAGKSYTLSAFLKCSSGTLDINFKPELGADPWTGYGAQIFTMTDQWQEFSVSTGVLAENVDPGTITFHVAFEAADFWIDDVRFYEE